MLGLYAGQSATPEAQTFSSMSKSIVPAVCTESASLREHQPKAFEDRFTKLPGYYLALLKQTPKESKAITAKPEISKVLTIMHKIPRKRQNNRHGKTE
eukprot:6400295-Amphidinium_carterae.1